MKGRITPQSMIITYLEDNGPCTVKDIAEGISSKYRQDLTCKEISSYIHILNGHNMIEVKGRYKDVNVWGLPATAQA